MLMSGFDNILIVVVVLGMVAIGFYFSKKATSMDNFYLAGRSLPWSLTVGTLVATWYGASGTVAAVEGGAIYGVSIWVAWCVSSHLSRIPMAMWVGPKVRMTTGMTVPDMLQNIYGKLPALIGSIIMFFYCCQFFEITAIGMIGTAAWGLNEVLVAVIVVVITILLASLGGLMSVAVTDMILFWFMCVGMCVALPLIWSDVGGWAGILPSFTAAEVEGGFLAPLGGITPGRFIMFVLLGLSAYADPTFYQRFSASDKPSTARRALLMCMTIWLVFDAALISTGLVTKAMFPGENPGPAYLRMVLSYLPGGIRALFIVGVLGSIISTLDSYFLTAGTTLSNDIIGRLRKRPLSQRELIFLTRIGTVSVGILGILISMQFTAVMDGWVFMSSLWISSAFVPLVGGLFWPLKKTYLGGTLSMLAGAVTSGVLYFFPAGDIDSLLIALPASMVAFLIGNMFGKDVRSKVKESMINE